MNGKLTRSRTDKFLGGVCGGLGQYLGVDSSIVRIIFLLLMFGSGLGLPVYILLWIILPAEGTVQAPISGPEFERRLQGMGDDIRESARAPHPRAGLWFGAALIVVGGVLFVERLGIPWLAWIHTDIVWPVLVICIGVAFLMRGMRKDN
jgi:phage shock protein C